MRPRASTTAMLRRRLPPLAGLLVALALVWGGAAFVLGAMDGAAAQHDQKFQSAERAVFYRLQPGETLTLDLAAQAKELRLLTHLVLPEGAAYAPERQYVYGLELRFEHPGAPEQPTSLYTRTRQSKDGLQEGVWAREHAFALEASTQITDAREFLVEVPDVARPAPGVISLKYPGEQGSLLVRVYGRYERLQSLFVRSEQVRRAESRTERATALPWEKLPMARQRELARVEWEPLAARGEAGMDFDTFTVYRTPFRLPLVEVEESAQSLLAAGAGVAINVRGPASPTLRLWRDRTVGAPREAKVELWALGWDGTRQSWQLPRPQPGEVSAHPLQVPAGIHTLALVNTTGEELRYAFEGERASWFAPAELKGELKGELQGEPASVGPLVPHTQRTEAWAVGAGCAPAHLDVSSQLGDGGHGFGRLLRVDARALSAAPPGAVTLSLFDANGRHVKDTRLELLGDPAPFEAVELAGRTGTAIPCEAQAAAAQATLEATPRPLPVAAAVSGKLFLPAKVTRVEVRADAPAVVQLFSYLPSEGEPRLGLPYGELVPAQVRWAHAPIDRRGWHPLRPGNHRELARAGAEVALIRQIRLEPVGPDVSAPAVGEPVTLLPSGTPASQELFEPDLDVADDSAARSLFALLTPGRAVKARFDARSPARPELRLHLDDAAGLGHEVEILVDGEVVRRHRLRATRSRALLPPIPSGVREVTVRSSAPGLSAALNRAPAAGEAAFAHRSRTIFRLSRGGLRVPVVKKGHGAETLNIVVYTPERTVAEGVRLEVSIDGGNPARRVGELVPRITRAVRELELEGTTRPAGRVPGRRHQKWYPRTVAVTLAEDLPPGIHWVRVKPSTAAPLWARFFVLGDAELKPGVQQWNRPGWDVEETP